jgi:hypothetical protein
MTDIIYTSKYGVHPEVLKIRKRMEEKFTKLYDLRDLAKTEEGRKVISEKIDKIHTQKHIRLRTKIIELEGKEQ